VPWAGLESATAVNAPPAGLEALASTPGAGTISGSPCAVAHRSSTAIVGATGVAVGVAVGV